MYGPYHGLGGVSVASQEPTSSPSQPRVTSQPRVNLESSQFFILSSTKTIVIVGNTIYEYSLSQQLTTLLTAGSLQFRRASSFSPASVIFLPGRPWNRCIRAQQLQTTENMVASHVTCCVHCKSK